MREVMWVLYKQSLRQFLFVDDDFLLLQALFGGCSEITD
jgi:hypothetical protein